MFGQTVGWHPESRTVHRRRQSEYRSAPYCASLRLYERHPFEQAFLSSDRQTGKVAALYPALLQPDAYCRDGGACSGHAHPWNLRQGLNGLICFHPFTQPSLNLSDLCVQRLQPTPAQQASLCPTLPGLFPSPRPIQSTTHAGCGFAWFETSRVADTFGATLRRLAVLPFARQRPDPVAARPDQALGGQSTPAISHP